MKSSSGFIPQITNQIACAMSPKVIRSRQKYSCTETSSKEEILSDIITAMYEYFDSYEIKNLINVLQIAKKSPWKFSSRISQDEYFRKGFSSYKMTIQFGENKSTISITITIKKDGKPGHKLCNSHTKNFQNPEHEAFYIDIMRLEDQYKTL